MLELEPIAKNAAENTEKVDIRITTENGTQEVTQVKHSRNPIGLPECKKWAAELKLSYNADNYRLVLLGIPATTLAGRKDLDGVEIVLGSADVGLNLEFLSHRIGRWYEK